MSGVLDTRAQCPKCKVKTWSQDVAGFLRDHDTPNGKRCSYRPGAVWIVLSNIDGLVLAVFGSSIPVMEITAVACKIEAQTGCATVRHDIIGVRPRVGQSISMKQ